MPEPEWTQIMRSCERWLSSRRPQTAAEALRAAADALDPDAEPDHYGEGAIVEDFEAHFAQLLGMEAAMLAPSGTMVQQIALRLHCDRRGTQTVAFHPTCHLALHEHAGFAHLHRLTVELVGERDRLISLADLQASPAAIGALLLELPQREIGGQLPEWDELVAQVEWTRGRGAAVHLDGARLWEAAPFYARPHAEIAGLFDTVYVSLYKGLLGLGGSVLAGPAELIEQARVWRRRHGGTLVRMFPFAAAAQRGLDDLVPQMPRFLDHARRLASALADIPGVTTIPDPPQTPLFHLHLSGDRDALWERALEIARERGVWLLNPPQSAQLPGACRVEVNIGEPALEISPEEAAELLAEVVDAGRRPAG